jgi:CIC family chloride channel protein
VSNPPIDIAVVRYRKYRRLHSVLVPVSGGPNSRQAVKMATTMARLGENGPVKVKLLHVVPTGSPENTYVRAEQAITQSIEGISYDDYEKIILESNDVAAARLTQAETDCDLIVIGATEEPIFKNLLFGNIPDQIAKSAKITVVIVKRRRSQLHTFVRSVIHELFR